MKKQSKFRRSLEKLMQGPSIRGVYIHILGSCTQTDTPMDRCLPFVSQLKHQEIFNVLNFAHYM